MTATTQLAVTRLTLNDTWCEALFASGLQPSDAPTAYTVVEAINCTVQQFGMSGCAGRMAQEFGDHPDAAATRMRWVRRLSCRAGGWPPASHGELPGLERKRVAHASAAVTPRKQQPGLARGSRTRKSIKQQETTHERDM